jgi:hypothetical protein
MFPASDFPLHHLASYPVLTTMSVREDQGFVMPRNYGLGAQPDHIIIGIRPLTDAQFAGVHERWRVRSLYAATGHTRLKVGEEPTRDNVGLLGRLQRWAAQNAPTPTGLTCVMPEPDDVPQLIMRADARQGDVGPHLSAYPIRGRTFDYRAVPVIRRAHPIETSRFVQIGTREVLELGKRRLEHDAKAEKFELLSEPVVVKHEVMDGNFRWHDGHMAVHAPLRERHWVAAFTADL